MNTNRRKFLGLALATATFAAVGAAAATAASVEEIKSKGTLVVGIQGDNAPWGFVNSSGKQDGFDADVATLFAKELGVKVQFQPLAVANRIPALTTGKVDILFATMAMTQERAKSIQYSKPYAANTISLYAAKADTVKSPADVAGWEIGVPKSSSQDKAVTDAVGSTATLRRFDDDAATIQALISGQVKAVGGNQFYGQRLDAASAGTYERKIDFLTTYNGVGTRLGEHDWNETVNAFLDKIKGNGELAAITKKWMAIDLPKFPESIPNIPFTVK
ncbi:MULTISPECIES: transporter substrate-binding domain-containing protein [unclassified Rhizobium]|uniref:transporter substrate-binding domain-containing protein n=1 Tax=unclassified Rhizobium TaxID=2613769 RepID=UPI0010525085|nr:MULTISPECIES: transporter substrate-binding domain-containing protein [unclassified Rhizobium]MBB3395484.1 polar amino acid transport system substrate-binding protein [Rhizobium sp. BK060]MBB4168835.1 polar amino acid transport system substrate-binding protein [Rhizobium sp. BK538]TCM75139.1 amino acid ABC transporter substrate-binding protein (PAAT family) [Rhizobium sp. BK068]